MGEPELSIVVAFFEMQREARRTLHTLSPAYQREVAAADYEVIAVDTGERPSLDAALVDSFPGRLRALSRRGGHPSPVEALNAAVRLAAAPRLLLVYDGARLLSPGLVAGCRRAFGAFAEPFCFTVAMHLGPDVQNASLLTGYDQRREDALLESIDWRANGYLLFGVSALAASSRRGLLTPPNESGAVALSRRAFDRLGGYDERFRSPGGGLANVDFFGRARRDPSLEPVLVVGEATFHQFHGGVATNVPVSRHPYPQFLAEYEAIRGAVPGEHARPAHLLGSIPPEAAGLQPSPSG